MENLDVLLAKPIKKDSLIEEVTLFGHARRTEEVFTTMFGGPGHPTRLGSKWLQFFKIENGLDDFLRTMPAVCYLHDIGKANSGFQEAVRGKPDAQVIRHEHLSALLLWQPEIRRLLEEWKLNQQIILSTIISHHLKARYEDIAEPLNPDRKTFNVFSTGINELLEGAANTLEARLAQPVIIPEQWSFVNHTGWVNPVDIAGELKRELYRYSRKLRQNLPEHSLLMAMRSALIAADSAASGLVREGKNIKEWLDTAFDNSQIINGEAIEQKIINPRIEQVKKERVFEWKDFQKAADKLPERTLMLASCGSGKTLAAWRWIQARAAEKPIARVIFLYPTRGTATEGFRDYVSWAPEADAALLHGTSAFELDGMFDDLRSEKEFITEDRLFALCYWQRRIFSATVDQFLGFMQNTYRSTCLLPLISDSIIVIDEVHSFDRSLFSALKRFLQAFDVPVLCMTASLPVVRQHDLEQCGLTIFPSTKEQFADLQKNSEMPRYEVQILEETGKAREIALTNLHKGKRVLWVVNTVARCQHLAQELKASCYHSRFKLEDRRRHHDDVIKAYKSGGNAVLAITTQVCEMSLDLDADILITEQAPITSLIQRMGRCNRHAQFGQGKLGGVYIYSPPDEKPYAIEDLAGSKKFCQEIDKIIVSQAKLEELLEQFGPSEIEPEKFAAFLESGPWAKSREESLREDNEYTVQTILDTDIDSYIQIKQAYKPTDGLIVPVPKRFAHPDNRVEPFSVASSSYYSSDYGFLDSPQEVKE